MLRELETKLETELSLFKDILNFYFTTEQKKAVCRLWHHKIHMDEPI